MSLGTIWLRHLVRLLKYEGGGVGLDGWAEVKEIGMMGAARKTGHSTGRCPIPIMLEQHQNQQAQWHTQQ